MGAAAAAGAAAGGGPARGGAAAPSRAADEAALAMVNGDLTTVSTAVVPATDLGLVRGDGVFEVVEVHQGVAFALPEHLARLAKSASALALPLDLDIVRAEVEHFLEALGSTDGAVRLIITRSGTRLLLHEAVEDVPAQMRLALVPHRPTPLLVGVKSLSYAFNMHATRLAQAQGADEALLYSPDDNQVLEGPTSSFAWVAGGRLYTPPLSAGILDSITRRVLLEVTDAQERACTLEEVAEAEGACVMGTGIGVVPVSEIQDVVRFADADGSSGVGSTGAGASGAGASGSGTPGAHSPAVDDSTGAPAARRASALISEAARAVSDRIRRETRG